ncbi:hypothetical protein CRYUN_Cryun09bG0207400 [Craigia yunnanensis]
MLPAVGRRRRRLHRTPPKTYGVREKLYKSSIQKAKETLRIKMMKTGLANMMEEKRDMAESLEATKTDAAETEAEYGLLNTRRNELMDELIGRTNDFVELRAMENLLKGFLGTDR